MDSGNKKSPAPTTTTQQPSTAPGTTAPAPTPSSPTPGTSVHVDVNSEKG